MREIRFRAWVNEEDEEYSRMVISEQAVVTILSHKYGKTGVAKPSGFSDIDNQPKPERYVIMQYTGLKDKNGTEVYEGDIIKAERGGMTARLIIRWNNYHHGYRAYEEKERYGRHISLNDLDSYEVIGNMFEDEGLLEGVGT